MGAVALKIEVWVFYGRMVPGTLMAHPSSYNRFRLPDQTPGGPEPERRAKDSKSRSSKPLNLWTLNL